MKLVSGTYTVTIPENGRTYVLEHGTYDIDPASAQRLLESNRNNRNVYNANVRKMERAHVNNHWKYTGDPIRIDTNGNLLDGQHRLLAAMNTGTTLRVPVVSGLPTSYFEYIDISKPRSARDALALLGTRSPAIIASMVTFLWQLAHDKSRPSLREAPTPPEALELFLKFGDKDNNILYPHAALATKGQKAHFPGAAVGIMSLLYEQISPEQNRRFWEGALDNLDIQEVDDPRKALKDHIDRFVIRQVRGAEAAIRSDQGARWIHHAWQKFIDGKPIKKHHQAKGFHKTASDLATMDSMDRDIALMANALIHKG